MDLEKIKSFYTIESRYQDQLYLNNKFIQLVKKPLIFTFGNKTIDTIEKAKNDPNCIVTDTESFYKEYFNLTDSEFRVKYFGLDDRSYKYLRAVKENIGLIENCSYEYVAKDWDYLKVKERETHTKNIPLNVEEMTIGKYKEVYVMQYYVQTDIDDYCIPKYFFRYKPKIHYVFTIDRINAIQRKLQETKSPYFKCWECGRQTHWLDVEGNLEKKADEYLDSHYCGC